MQSGIHISHDNRYTSLFADGLCTCVSNFVDLLMENDSQLFDVLKASVDKLDWHSASRSFDNTTIQLTRPGFGTIALIAPDQLVHRLRDKLADKLLLRTRDELMHMTIFQVFITFTNDYDSSTLPSNLLAVFQEYMDEQLLDQIQEVNKHINETTVQATKEWLILGKDIPSHLAIRVHCRPLEEVLSPLKRKANELSQAWMSVLTKALAQHQIHGRMDITAIGATVHGKGWNLTIGYTANVDYKTHVTLGIFPTGDPKMDHLVRMQHRDINRAIAPTFSPSDGDPKSADMALDYFKSIARFQIDRLRALRDDDIKSYPSLAEQVWRAKQGQEVTVSRFVMDEWGKLCLSILGDLNNLFTEDSILHVTRIKSDIINMDRMQNFE